MGRLSVAWIGALVFAPMVLSPVTTTAQAVLHVPGKTVEVIGLHHWTIAMIQDSLAVHSPGDSLTSHACAAILRYKLGFADAAAMYYPPMAGDSVTDVVVSVVEPQDSARVRYKAAPLDTTHPHPGWESAIALLQHDPMAVQAALVGYSAWRARQNPDAIPEWAREDSAAVLAYWGFLAAHASDAEWREAMAVLADSPDYRNRVLAVSILANHLDRDTTLWALVDALRESDGMVKGMAGQVLAAVTASPRPVNWRPAAPAIHAMLDGTSLFELPTLMRILVATHVQPELAAPLLRGGGRMLLAYAGAQHRPEREAAHALLVALAGGDLGPEMTTWQRWVDGL